MPYLTWVMSKFMGLGFSLEQVVAMATVKPAAVINRTPKLGSLQVGAPGGWLGASMSASYCPLFQHF
jgi:dihydroorotase